MKNNDSIVFTKTFEVEFIVREKTANKKKQAAVKVEKATTASAPVVKPLNDYSWAEIKEIAKRGEAQTYFRVGDKKEIPLPNGETLTVAIAAFYHDKDKDGNVLPITFTTVNLLEESACMNEDDTNKGGWKESEMRDTLKRFFAASLPIDLQNVITGASKGETVDNLFLFNEIEVFGHTEYSDDNFGEQYPYYAEKCHRCKFKNSEDYARYWWLRSPCASYSAGFCSVDYGGIADYGGASSSSGVAFGFCV